MPARETTILATSGDMRDGRRIYSEFGESTECAGVSFRARGIGQLATAQGDNPNVVHTLYSAAQERGHTLTPHAARTDHEHNATLHTICRSFGDVRTTADLVAMVDEGTAACSHPEVRTRAPRRPAE